MSEKLNPAALSALYDALMPFIECADNPDARITDITLRRGRAARAALAAAKTFPPGAPDIRGSLITLRDLWTRWPKVSAHEMQEACKAANAALGVAKDACHACGGEIKAHITPGSPDGPPEYNAFCKDCGANFPPESPAPSVNTPAEDRGSGATEKEPSPPVSGEAGIFCEWRVYPNGYASPPWHLCNAIGFEDPNRDVVKFCNGCGKPIKWKGAE